MRGVGTSKGLIRFRLPPRPDFTEKEQGSTHTSQPNIDMFIINQNCV